VTRKLGEADAVAYGFGVDDLAFEVGFGFDVEAGGATGGLAIVTWQMVPESLVDTFINQNAHLGACEEKLFRFFECSDCEFTRDCGKSIQKVFECFSAFEVIEKRLEGYARSAKNGGSA
jgi:hypothetical protein